MPGTLRKPAIVAAVIALWSAVFFVALGAQTSQKPWTKEQIVRLLKGEVPPKRVAEMARERGIDFEMTAETESELRDAGADAGLISVLRDLAPKPRAKVSEIVVQTSADAEVYVDDQFSGRTSPEGRLKVGKLTPGEHVLRVALAGYRDHEEKIELKAGESRQVDVQLTTSGPGVMSSGPTTSAAKTPSGPLNGFYSGEIENLTISASAKISASIRELNGSVQGCLRVERPLFGSGSIAGSEQNGDVNFQVASPLFAIQGIGTVQNDNFSGTVTGRSNSDTAVQQGRFTLRRTNSASQPTAADLTDCPTETAQDVVNYAGTSASQAVTTFTVAHDHGSMTTYCVGLMTVGNGGITFRSTIPAHSFSIRFSEIREIKRNGIYLAAIGGFHITPRNGRAVNFVVLNSLGQYQSPDPLLRAADSAMGANR